MANLYTGNGTQISVGGELTNAQVKSALLSAVASGDVNLGATIGATLSYISPGTAWETNAETAYQNLLNAYKEIPNSGIPFFISTDQHGRGVEVNRWLNNHDKSVNGMEVMNLNLGDTVTDVFNEFELSSIYNRSRQIKNHIMVFGNHEIKMSTEVPNLYDLNRWFISTRGRKFYIGPMGCFTVYDDAHSVKYVCVANYILDEAGNSTKGLTADAAKWLLAELAKNDGYDVIYLQHWPMYTSRRNRNEIEEQVTDTARENANPETQNYKIWQMLKARKAKASGTFQDCDGNTHDFDFSICENNLLCTLHGHEHVELMSTADGLTAYAADLLSDSRRCTFGLIDRLNSKVTFWVFDSTGCLDPLELPI